MTVFPPKIRSKGRSRLILSLVCCLILSSLTTSVQAEPVSPPSPPLAPVSLNPESLRTYVLDKNISLLIELNEVFQAKLKLNQARADLLPSMNLSAALKSVGPTFMLSSVSFLLPFLLPSNWFALKEQRALFESEKVAYYILELNVYSSAFSTYMTALSDLSLKQVLQTQHDNLKKIRILVETKIQFGLASQADLMQAQAHEQLALVQLSQMEELLLRERSALRLALALPLNQEINLEPAQVSASDFENFEPQKLLDLVQQKSPEYNQIHWLIEAAKAEKWSAIFGFLTGNSLKGTISRTGSPSFSRLTQTGSASIGFSIIPTIQLGAAAIDQLKLRAEEIKFENAQIIESTLGSIQLALVQKNQAELAEDNLRQVFEIQLENYNLGLTDLLHVIDAQNSITVASTSKISSQLDLDNLRINLHRLVLTDQFAKIPLCQAKQGKERKGFKDFFNSRASQKSVDDLCRQKKD